MSQILIRFVIGGAIVSVFAVVGDLFQPKSFGGLFGAAPSVALATLGMTVVAEGAHYAATEAHSMMAGAIALFVYSWCVSWIAMHHKVSALVLTSCLLPLWAAISFGIYYTVLR
jgi:uncharacterized protein DUF3147